VSERGVISRIDREDASVVEVYGKPLKTQRAITHGCLHGRQLASRENIKINAESDYVGVRKGCGRVLRRSIKEERLLRKRARGLGRKRAELLGLKGEVTRGEFLALASNEVPGTEETGPDKGQANGGLRFLLFGSEVGLGLLGTERRPGGGTDDQ
jgi:hypothetical protein